MTVSRWTWSTRRVVLAAMVGALYSAAVLALAPFSFGPIQLRGANVLKALVLFSPDYSFGIAVGVIMGNLGSPFGPLDFIVMPVIDLASGLLAYRIRRWWWLALFLQALFTAAGVSFFPLQLGGGIPFWTTFPLILPAQLLTGFAGYFMFRPFRAQLVRS